MKSYKKIHSDSLNTPMSIPRGSSSAKRKVSILFIENDAQEVAKVKKTISKESNRFNLISVANTTEALASLESHLPNIILLDINIPNLNGIEFLTMLKKHEIFKSIPIVILTSINKNIESCYKLGIAGYLLKPSKEVDYEIKINSLLEYWSLNEFIIS
ncbi:MAG: CheY-like chemotaxis protein [Polaribacter sp.]|jgi:CheY-like chemotaxis protein